MLAITGHGRRQTKNIDMLCSVKDRTNKVIFAVLLIILYEFTRFVNNRKKVKGVKPEVYRKINSS